MSDELKYQLRLTLRDPFADARATTRMIRQLRPSRKCCSGTTQF